jgi:hypothetical protein
MRMNLAQPRSRGGILAESDLVDRGRAEAGQNQVEK